ncbi:MAG: HAMP domain-containing sensor histidine kinase [Rhodothermales bacterium]
MLVVLVVGGLASLLSIVPIGFILLLSAVVGVSTALLVRGYVLARLRRIDAALTQLRDGRLESDTDEAGDELERLARKSDQAIHAVNRRLAELNRAEDYRREYLGDVSHELKTPIFAIQGFAETLLSGALDDANVNRSFVDKILQNANRLTTLVRDLSEISRLETGSLKITPGRFSISEVMNEVKDSLELAAGTRGIDLKLEVHGGYVQGDRERIRQVLTNLVENSIKYNNPGGCVQLTAERAEGGVRIVVQDNGIGISAVDLPRVTQRFFRADKSRSRSQGGTGLGLSIVKHILVGHGASLQIESELGIGSTFSFILPAA